MKTRNIMVLALILALLVISAATAVKNDGKQGSHQDLAAGSDRFIVLSGQEGDAKLLRNSGCHIIHRFSNAMAVTCPSGKKAVVASRFETVPDEILMIQDVDSNTQIGAGRVHSELGITGKGVTVAVIDTGVDTTHTQLADSIAGGKSFVRYTTSYSDDNGHGTHVSGIITANGAYGDPAIGVAPDAKIWMAKACDSGGRCYTSDIMSAITHIVNNKVAKVISISLGGGGTGTGWCNYDLLGYYVNWAANKGVTVVAAAGNTPGVIASPACAQNALAVGAVDDTNVIASWSGTGYGAKLVAPGVSIRSTIPGGYKDASGTSMATPHVSGTVALMLQKKPTLTRQLIRDTLYAWAVPLGDPGWDRIYGFGRIDTFGTVQSLGNLGAYAKKMTGLPQRARETFPTVDALAEFDERE